MGSSRLFLIRGIGGMAWGFWCVEEVGRRGVRWVLKGGLVVARIHEDAMRFLVSLFGVNVEFWSTLWLDWS